MKKFLAKALLLGASMLALQPCGMSAEQLDYFIMNGQSLSTGHQSWPVVSTENVAGNYMLGTQIWLNYGWSWGGVPALNPLVGTLSVDFKNASDNGTRNGGAIAECPLLGAVNHLQLKYGGNKILATSVGVSGASVEELSKECTQRTYYNDVFVKILMYAKNAVSRSEEDYTLHCPAIFWMQGEFNYIVKDTPCGLHAGENNTTDKKEYKALMLKLKDNMQADIKAKYSQTDAPIWVTYQTGAQYVRGNLSIGMAQLEAANENDDVVMAGPVYQMTDRGGHLDANGYRWYGEILAKAYYQTKVQGKKFMPLQPKKIVREDNGKTIRVKFLVPVGPLAFDTDILPKIKNYGFNVYHKTYAANNKQNIKSIAIDGDDVVMTFDNALTEDVIVTYADHKASIETGVSGKNGLQGHGNLRDSDPYESVLKYIDLDGKDASDNYIYDRAATETTLRPDFEPKDADGNVIYGKGYPLYNFAVGFYYRMPKGSDETEILDKCQQSSGTA